jgi:hypothetical protein
MDHDKLFAVYLGGSAPGANTELHDVVFVTGDKVESTYQQLLERWFGSPRGLHIDSWLELDVVDGYRITLSGTRAPETSKLFFVNLGAYAEDEFTELHSNRFVVAESAAEAKQRTKSEWRKGGGLQVHKDNLCEVDTCLEVGTVNHQHVVLTKTGETSELGPHNRYHPIPRDVVAAYVARRSKQP